MSDLIGKIELSEKEKIVITLTEWNGEKGIDIRKYLETESYNGPTRQGVRIHNNGLKSLLKILDKINISDEFSDEQIIGCVAKDFDHDIVIKISFFTGSPKIDLRERINSKKGEYYTKKGVTIPFQGINRLKEILYEANWAYENN